MTDNKKELEEFFDTMIKDIGLKELIIAAWKRRFFDGFYSFSDYEKYGDAFIPIEKEEKK